MADALMQDGYHAGWVSAKGAVFPAPSECFEQILKNKPDSRYRLEIAMKLPLGLAHQGRFDAARTALEMSRTWLKEYKIKGLAIDPEFYESSNHAVARLALVTAQVARLEAAAGGISESDAAEAARQACSATLKYGALRAEAFDERLGSLLRLKDYAAARAEAESLLSEINTKKVSELSAARGTAFFTLGQCNLEAGLAMQKNGQTLQANQQFAEARWNFLNVVAGSIELDRHIPGAHYFAAHCSELLARIEPNGIRDASVRRRLLINRFPESSFAKLAQAQIVK